MDLTNALCLLGWSAAAQATQFLVQLLQLAHIKAGHW
jgi:hypothetical protein